MNFNQLEYFVCAAENLNFTKAAKKCYISQTAMTLQIKALEETIGTPLFIRDHHHVELTTAGKVYLNEAREILERSNEAIRLARTAADGIEGSLKIGFVRGFGEAELSELLKGFHSVYPNIQLQFIRENSSVLHQMVEKGECDAAFTVASRRKDAAEALEWEYLSSFPVLAVVYPGHPLANRNYLTYPSLKEERFIIMQPAGSSRDEMDESLLIYERGGFFPEIVSLEPDPETLLLMVSIGMGISILPEYVLKNRPKNRNFKTLPLVKADGSRETVDVEICIPKIRNNPALSQLLDSIQNYRNY